MQYIESIIFGIVQGITELLPISSTAHLILLPKLFGWEEENLVFDIFLHLGSSIGLLICFYKDWLDMCKSTIEDISKSFSYSNYSNKTKLFLMIIVTNIPVGIVGILFEKEVENIFRNPIYIAVQLIIISIVMFIADLKLKRKNILNTTDLKLSSIEKNINHIPFKKALLVSLSQIIALIPGTSRSGITISTGILLNIDKNIVTKYTFLLSTPLIFGAAILNIKDLVGLSFRSDYLLGFLFSFIFSILSVKFLMIYLKNHNLAIFIAYRILLAFIIIYFIV